MPPSIADLAAATPDTRDRYVDFLRAFSIVAVVLGHYVIALIHWEGGRIFVHNVVGHQSGAWLATWVLQVMPVFFFVGGFSNFVGWRSATARGDTPGTFLRSRLKRLLGPTAVFIAAWVVIEILLRVGGLGADGVLRSTFLPFGPMWFLAVYAFVVALAPWTIRLHGRWGWRVPLVLAGVVALVDTVRFGFGLIAVGWVNLAVVWLAVHQLGYFYADGGDTAPLIRIGRRGWAGLIGIGLGTLIVLTNLELFTDDLFYPRSMVGVDIEPVSNMSPPSFAIVGLATWQIGLAMWLREPVTRWLQRAGPWQMTIAVNSVIMTLFLWHLTGLLVAVVVLHPIGLGNEVTATLRWWLERPIWVLAPLLLTMPIVGLFRRYERIG